MANTGHGGGDLATRIKSLRDALEKAKREEAVAEGALRTAIERLQKEHGCKDEKEAAELIKKLEKEIAAEEKALEREVSELEGDAERWTRG